MRSREAASFRYGRVKTLNGKVSTLILKYCIIRVHALALLNRINIEDAAFDTLWAAL